jgi:hypothetical protein
MARAGDAASAGLATNTSSSTPQESIASGSVSVENSGSTGMDRFQAEPGLDRGREALTSTRQNDQAPAFGKSEQPVDDAQVELR